MKIVNTAMTTSADLPAAELLPSAAIPIDPAT